MRWKDEKYVKTLGRYTLQDDMEDPDVDGRIIKWNL
jgi:hypothetical protein